MKVLRIIFVDQLSKNNPTLDNILNDDHILFYEPIDTFYEINHHKHKITFLISSLRFVNQQKHKNIIHKKITKNYKFNLNNYLKELISDYKFTKIIATKPSDFKTNNFNIFLSIK